MGGEQTFAADCIEVSYADKAPIRCVRADVSFWRIAVVEDSENSSLHGKRSREVCARKLGTA